MAVKKANDMRNKITEKPVQFMTVRIEVILSSRRLVGILQGSNNNDG